MLSVRRWALRTLLGCGYAGALFVACSDDGARVEPGSTGGGDAGASSVTASSTATSTSGSEGSGGEAPLVCAEPIVQTQPRSVVTGECDLLDQDCQLGRTCVAVQDPRTRAWSTKCTIAPGLKGPGKPCVAPDECEAGLFCIGGQDAFCAAPCCPPTNEPCGNGLCNLFTEFENGLFVWMCSYDEGCELFAEDACVPGRDCHISDIRQGRATCVRLADRRVDEGQPCDYLNECGDMQHCDAPGLEARSCRYYCYLQRSDPLPPGGGGCPEGQACQQVNVGRSDVGICRPP
jgi:hypothetical protein